MLKVILQSSTEGDTRAEVKRTKLVLVQVRVTLKVILQLSTEGDTRTEVSRTNLVLVQVRGHTESNITLINRGRH
jgi:hypothetical protein